jgi:hypothetical protein
MMMKGKGKNIPRPIIYMGCAICLLFVLFSSFACGTVLTVAADELGLWDGRHEAAETADEVK